ncbi:MAG: S-layer homology domain-containing protein, partial [Clostridia bacterium]|nr:S-layer homology domain-containing protein [Clostridia bacterium]
YLYENDIMIGESDTIFNPDGALNRAMIVTILHRIEGKPEVTYTGAFTDVPAGEWYTDGVEWAASHGIVLGYGDGRYGPLDPVTREQLATILFRYANWKGYDTSVGEDTNILSYDDAFDVADWAMPAMQWACGACLYDPAGTETALRPQEPATRAEIAVAIYVFLTTVAQ